MADMVATRVAYGKALEELGGRYGDIVVMDADLSKSTMTAGFASKYPDRFVQMGIAEQDMMATAAGIATMGKKVFASTFAVFAAGRAYDQVRNSIAYGCLNVKVCATHAGLSVGEDGASHQMLEDIALMRVLPNMSVLCPADATSAGWAVEAAYGHDGPVYVRLGRAPVPVYHPEGTAFSIGGSVPMAKGEDVTIIACGMMLGPALEAVGLLADQGISAGLLDMYSIKPLDEGAVLKAAGSTGAVVTAEEHSVIGGLGGAVCELLSGRLPVPVVRVGVNDVFGESGKPAQLMVKYGLTAADIAGAALRAIGMKRDAIRPQEV